MEGRWWGRFRARELWPPAPDGTGMPWETGMELLQNVNGALREKREYMSGRILIWKIAHLQCEIMCTASGPEYQVVQPLLWLWCRVGFGAGVGGCPMGMHGASMLSTVQHK